MPSSACKKNHARAEHRAGRAQRDPCGVDGGAETGRKTAREQARAVEWSFGVDLRQRDLRHDRVLRERARAHEVTDRLAVTREPSRAGGEMALVLLLADRETQGGAMG